MKQADVLVVEDVDEMRNVLVHLLDCMNFVKVKAVRNGEEAWQLLNAGVLFDVVLCDWNMPRLSGRELLDRVRADTRLCTMPFIMITGESSQTRVKSAIDAGVTDFLLKPFTISSLEERLKRALDASPSWQHKLG